MESQRRDWGAILPATAFIAALSFGACTEPREDKAPPEPATELSQQELTPSEQDLARYAQLTIPNLERNAPPTVPTTKEPVHVARDEFEVSGPFTHDNLEVFLIHSDRQRATRRKILTLEEALEQKKVKVHETGNVQELAIENLTDDTDIFVQSGDIVQGGKQDRVLSMDLLLQPKSGKVPLASFCVEQGRWSARNSNQLALMDRQARAGQQASAGGAASYRYDMSSFISSANSLSSKELKRAVRVTKAQQEVWNEVSEAQGKLTNVIGDNVASALSASSLELMLNGEKVQAAAGKYKKALESIVADKKDVVGYAFAINGQLNSAEIYATNSLFERLWGKMLNACAVEAVSVANEKKGDTKPTTADAVKTFLAVEKDTAGKGHSVNDRMQLITVDGKAVVFSETRDKHANSAWVHRSYLAK